MCLDFSMAEYNAIQTITSTEFYNPCRLKAALDKNLIGPQAECRSNDRPDTPDNVIA